MIALFCLFLALSASPFKSKNRLAAENAALRHQLIVLQRRVRGRIQLTNGDRLFLVTLYRWFPSVLKTITIVRPETLVRWHRAGFRRYWRWKSRSLGGRPKIDAELRALIRRMSAEKFLVGSAAHSWRVAQARLRGRSVQRREVDGSALGFAICSEKKSPAHREAQFKEARVGLSRFLRSISFYFDVYTVTDFTAIAMAGG
jgi:hypothetical protein